MLTIRTDHELSDEELARLAREQAVALAQAGWAWLEEITQRERESIAQLVGAVETPVDALD